MRLKKLKQGECADICDEGAQAIAHNMGLCYNTPHEDNRNVRFRNDQLALSGDREITMEGSLSEFSCRHCGACCRIKDGIVRVSDAEIARIAAFLGMTEQDFIDRETEVAPDRRGLILKNRPDGACAWLTAEHLCRIHPVKPDKCRTFPYEWTNDNSSDVCPGLAAKLNEMRLTCRRAHEAWP